MTLAARIVCVCFPSGDRAFARYVEQVLPTESQGPSALQERLRGVYPSAVVRPREISDETWLTWYVYRDGGALAAFGDPTWWTKPGIGHIHHVNGTMAEANDEVHGILGYPPGALVGQPSTILLVPPVEADALIIGAIFRETGLIESTLPIRTAAGESVVVEHRTELQPDGTVRSWVRPVSVVQRGEPPAD